LSVAAVAAALAACSAVSREERRDPPPVDPAAFTADFEQWRQQRDALYRDPADSPLAYVSLTPLGVGRTSFGSDPSMSIRLPEGTPAVAGTLIHEWDAVTLEVPPGVPLHLEDGRPVPSHMRMVPDRTHGTTVVAMGSLRLFVHEESGPSYWLRVIDLEHSRLKTFAGTPAYPPSLAWRVAAQLEPFAGPRVIDVPDVTGGTQRETSPGMLRFHVGDAVYRLMATTTGNRSRWSAAFKDATNRTETYGGGRYLSVAAPGPDGWTVIDFNQAYNPPCAYSAFTVCALPPSSNRLALAVTAGEKRLR
jgi:uncharacterized protein (DUF1684 family)